MPPKKKTEETTIAVASTPVVESKKSNTGVASAIPLKVNPNDSDRLQLAQAINNIVNRGDSLLNAINELSSFNKERLVQLDTQIAAKKSEYTDLMTSLENQYKDFEIKLRQKLHESKLDAVREILSALDMTYVTNAEFNRLTTELASAQSKAADDLDKAVSDERVKARQQLEAVQQSLTLSHKADVATLKAQVEQQVKEISVLKDTIQSLKFELAEQRNLTKSVAEASAKSQITQSFGK